MLSPLVSEWMYNNGIANNSAGRKQGRRVMELLRKAAARVVPAGGRCWR